MDPNARIGGPDAPYRKEKDPMPMRLARMVRLFIAADGTLTQKQVAMEIGINESTLSRFLSGEQMPDSRAFVALVIWCFGTY